MPISHIPTQPQNAKRPTPQLNKYQTNAHWISNPLCPAMPYNKPPSSRALIIITNVRHTHNSLHLHPLRHRLPRRRSTRMMLMLMPMLLRLIVTYQSEPAFIRTRCTRARRSTSQRWRMCMCMCLDFTRRIIAVETAAEPAWVSAR